MKAEERGMRWRHGLLPAAAFLLLSLSACTESIPYGGEFRPAPPPGAGARTVRGVQMIWPVRGTIASPYRAWSRPDHQGVDLAAPPGTPVVSALPGSVSFVGRIAGYGNVVAMEHEEHLTTVYSHLGDDLQAAAGVRLGSGEILGRVGTQGYLHFEIRLEKEAVDPSGYIADAPTPMAGVPVASADVSHEPERVPLGPGEGPPTEPTVAPTPAAVARAPEMPVEPPSYPPPTPTEPAAPPPPPPPAPTEPVAPPPPPPPTPTTLSAVEPTPVPGELGSRRAPTEEGTPEEETLAPPPPEEIAAIGRDAKPGGGSFGAGAGGGETGSLAAGLVVSNFLWVPAKLAYAGAGGVVGAFAFVLTGGAVTDVWSDAFGGDYFITAEHLRGDVPLRFRGSAAPG